jgi:hypothetical protein
VTTWHNDTYRTGDNLSESKITASSIQSDNFGQLCSAQLDGQVYAQPLVVTHVAFQSMGTFDVVYVVTENDTLYAINATPQNGTCQILGSLPFLTAAGLPTNGQSAVPCAAIGGPDCLAIKPTVGILGTPVINISGSTGTIYLVTHTEDSAGNFYHYLYAVDIQSLQQPAYVRIFPPGQLSGASTFSKTHIQRPGLLFASCGTGCGNYVYIAFSMMDGHPPPYPNGAIFGYNVSNLAGSYFYLPISQGLKDLSNGGGIWMGGAAPAFGTDSSGQSWIYLTTANGTFDLNTSGGTNAGDSLLMLNPNRLTIATPTNGYGYLTPVDEFYRSTKKDNQHQAGAEGDTDLGSTGVMLIPDGHLTNWQYLAVNGEKEGGLWFVDRTNPGGFDTACGNICSCTPTKSGNNVQTYWTGTAYSVNNPIHTSLAYWEYDRVTPFLDYVYVTKQQVNLNPAPLTRYPLCGSPSATGPIDFLHCTGSPLSVVDAANNVINFGWGATPAVSADGGNAADAIVWAISKPDDDASEGTVSGVLYAIDAVSMTQLYSSTSTCTNDAINPATKFSVPTVANGYVYVGAEWDNINIVGKGTFYIFGPNRPPNC